MGDSVDKGTGLGLSTIMGVAKTHGGFVTVSSALQKGTEFQVYLSALARTTGEGIFCESQMCFTAAVRQSRAWRSFLPDRSDRRKTIAYDLDTG